MLTIETAALIMVAGLPAGTAEADDLSRWVERARRADAELRADDDRLRFRHNIVHVIKLWQSAVGRAGGEARVSLLEREADAWALLAHWSGRADDARRAAAERAEAEAARQAVGARTAEADRSPGGVPAAAAAADFVQSAPTRARPDPRGTSYAPDAACVTAPRDPLTVHTIVVDPGHGGDDEGAENLDGVLEKDVNLALALELAARLEDFCVVLTRQDDDFVSLADRVRLANEVQGDLFVSVHANGSPHREFHGVETYVLATDASRYATRLRHREDEHHRHHGLAPAPSSDPSWNQDVRLLLADLAMRGATRDARRLAERVQAAVVERLRERHPRTKDLGVKSALFYVLLGARMPSILVEAGFMTHSEEGRRLATQAHREQVARGMADAIRAFAAERDGRETGREALFVTTR